MLFFHSGLYLIFLFYLFGGVQYFIVQINTKKKNITIKSGSGALGQTLPVPQAARSACIGGAFFCAFFFIVFFYGSHQWIGLTRSGIHANSYSGRDHGQCPVYICN